MLVSAAGGFDDIVEALIKAKANVNASDKNGKTVLAYATNPKVVALLKKYGAK